MAAPEQTAGRSYLYVPGDRRDRLDGAFGRGADALIVDLEDAIPSQGKTMARATVAGWLPTLSAPPCPVWVRINGASAQEDCDAAIADQVTGVVVPKADPDLLNEVDRLLSAHERRLRLDHGTFHVIALIETASGLLSAVELARAPRVRRLGLGEADLAADLGLIPSPDRAELASIRLQVVVASTVAGIAPPIAPTSTDLRDLDAFRRSSAQLLSLGFRARTAIHPTQVAVINEVFAPSPEQVAEATRVLASLAAAERAGSGVALGTDGRMVDAAVVRSAHDVLARAGQIN
jgi:citrate lyase subunit beta / citryl-CoA lyase